MKNINGTTLDYLSQNPLKHMDMIVPIKRGTAHILFSSKDGVCLKETKSGAYMLSAASREVGKRLIELLPAEGLFTFHQDFMLNDFKEKVRYQTFMENYQAVYLGKEPLPAPDNISLKPLDESYFDIVIKNYDINVGADYLRKLIKEGRLFGGFADCLVGFIGIHAEGSLGLLKVFGQHLKKGYGSAIVSLITNYRLSQGVVPFAQISVNNEASLAVFKKLGFSISTERVYWMW
ncbi:MAG: GNAT family N-acetyltransferase [Defluviitaleaceae bacterium]|nr:GNAT family N-acetyltransferase [Defluviitaleaceae bacterium]